MAVLTMNCTSGFAAGRAATVPSPYLILVGYIQRASSPVTLSATFLQDLPNDRVAAAGPCVAQLLGRDAALLASAYFTPGLTLLTQEPLVQGTADAPNRPANTTAHDLQEFSVSVPWHPATQQLQIKCGGTLIYRLDRSAHPPTIRLVEPGAADTPLHGTVAVAWQITAGDAAVLGAQLQFSRDQGRHWSPLTPFTSSANATAITHTSNTAESRVRVDTTLLPSGHDQRLRVLISDGLNTVYATRTITIANPLKIARTVPADQATDVSPFAPIEVQFVSSVPAAALRSNPLMVLDSQRQAVTGTLSYISDTQILRFKPNRPLQAGQHYQVQLAATLRDGAGNPLAGAVEWSFTTAKTSP